MEATEKNGGGPCSIKNASHSRRTGATLHFANFRDKKNQSYLTFSTFCALIATKYCQKREKNLNCEEIVMDVRKKPLARISFSTLLLINASAGRNGLDVMDSFRNEHVSEKKQDKLRWYSHCWLNFSPVKIETDFHSYSIELSQSTILNWPQNGMDKIWIMSCCSQQFKFDEKRKYKSANRFEPTFTS